jgi:hypothetical protein
LTFSSNRRERALQWIAAGALSVALIFMWASQFTRKPVVDDAAQSVRMGYNLAHQGLISLDRASPYELTNYREPVPVWVHALAIKAIEAALGPAPLEAYESGERLQYLKWENVFWLALLAIGAFTAVEGLTGSFWLALFAVVLLNITFRPHHDGGSVDDLMTEIPATAVLVAASFQLSVAYMRGALGHFIVAGILFGLLALIKAAALYAFLAVALLLLAASAVNRRYSWSTALGHTIVLVLASFVVVGPWVYRNHQLLGTTHIAQRGGEALYERALEDRMSTVEYVGSFYVWAPRALQGWLGSRLRFSKDDLMRGGRLQRLNDDVSSAFYSDDVKWEFAGRPDQAISFYSKARAQREQLLLMLDPPGHSTQRSYIRVDEILESQAVSMIKERPGAHLALTLPLLWRGAARPLPLLVFVVLIAFARSKYQLVVFVLPALMMVIVYGSLITFLPRFGELSYAVSILGAVVAARQLWLAARTRLGATRGGRILAHRT